MSFTSGTCFDSLFASCKSEVGPQWLTANSIAKISKPKGAKLRFFCAPYHFMVGGARSRKGIVSWSNDASRVSADHHSNSIDSGRLIHLSEATVIMQPIKINIDSLVVITTIPLSLYCLYIILSDLPQALFVLFVAVSS